MSGFVLDDSTRERIIQELPDVLAIQRKVQSVSPDFISIKFSPESAIPVALICLTDAVHTLAEARHALYELFAHRIWYEEKRDPPNEMVAVFFGRFYADDTALRLYSAGEHLANAIIFMLEINEKRFKRYKQRKISQQSAVGYFLKKEEPNHPITTAVLKLAKSKDWQKTIEYRNKWVHEQPPTVAGLGMIYERRKRWQRIETGYQLTAGGGDKPEYSIDDLVGFIQPAFFQFTDTMEVVVEFYFKLLSERGIIGIEDEQDAKASP